MRSSQSEVTDRWQYERSLWQSGLTRIAGVDEVGRGPLAGPVVAAAAVLPAAWELNGLPLGLQGLNDSKQLSEAKRERFFEFLLSTHEVCYGLAIVEPGIIDQINILQATHRAMNEALAQLLPSPDHVLVDGTRVKSITLPQTAIVKGDFKSYSIAAASVLAKVTRDRLMVEYGQRWPAYGFAIHKGYPTPQHLAALTAHGPCEIHRRSFSPVGKLIQEILL
jgi:ribonuclease HII